MNFRTIKGALGVSASILMMTGVAQALPTLTVSNGNFALYSGTAPGTNGDNFQSVNPTGWTGGGGLIFVTNQAGVLDKGLYLPTYLNVGPPPGGNFVEADGNPDYEDSFSYQLHGLTVGQTYTLSFFQAFSQQTGFSGDTTNQWIVGLGKTGSVFNTTPIGGGIDTYSYSDADGSVAASPLTAVLSQTATPWQQVSVELTADDADDVVTFLAWGDNGNTANLPPIAFLDIAGNGRIVKTPEPATIGLFAGGVLALGARLRRRKKRQDTKA